MQGSPRARKILFLIFGSLIALLVCLTAFFFMSRIRHMHPPLKPARALPLDVEAVIDEYRVNDESEGKVLRFEGKRLVRRGEKFWGVRSTVVKRNFFEDVKGTYSFKKALLRFSAREASWGLTGDSPIFLKGNVEIIVNDKKYDHASRALIHLQTGVVEVEGKPVPMLNPGSRT